MAKIKLEYLWLDGYTPVPNLRGKTCVKEGDVDKWSLEDCPLWGFDGSSTRQAEGNSSDCVLKPVALYPDGTRENGFLVMCEVMLVDGKAHPTNTRAAAARAGCTILFKGADTVIANEQGRAAINSAHYDRAAPWLATAGSGDVLAGFITGLMARGFAPMQAAESAAWLHVECALKFGPGLIAEDIPEQLPAVFRDLNL